MCVRTEAESVKRKEGKYVEGRTNMWKKDKYVGGRFMWKEGHICGKKAKFQSSNPFPNMELIK